MPPLGHGTSNSDALRRDTLQTQIATVAIKKGMKARGKALGQAIDDAGYDPVNLYTMKAGKLVVTSIALKK